MQNGQTVRAVINGKARTFVVAEVLSEEDNRDLMCGHSGIQRDATRWQELLIVRTAKGAIALRSAYRTRWQGEHGSETWALAASDDAAARLLADAAAGTKEGEEFDPADPFDPLLAKRALKDLDWWDLVAEEV